MQTGVYLEEGGSASCGENREKEGDGFPPSQGRGNPTRGAVLSLLLDLRLWQGCLCKKLGSWDALLPVHGV